MTRLMVAALALGALTVTMGSAPMTGAGTTAVVLDNARVKAYRVTGAPTSGIAHAPAVVVPLRTSPARKMGEAFWVTDAASIAPADVSVATVIVQPKDVKVEPPATAGSKPGEGTFTGMSFNPIFDNPKVAVIRARMEVDAREGFHTHGSDTIVVHLSGGNIEDTANGKTVVNHWMPGDVEFESRGSSHSARNVGGAVDVVLVALRP